MRDISEYTAETNPYELFTHIYWCIINRRINRVSELEAYLVSLPEGTVKKYTFESAFHLIKEMHWGFFSDLNVKSYPRLWKQLVIPHSNYPLVGELKRSMSITDIYTAFIDIHGYTAFCQTHGRHTSMLQLLDDCIENDIRRICQDNHVMGNRARGDEIILVGTSAFDVVNTVIKIADYFADGKLAENRAILGKRRAQCMKLPKLTISAGIAGGKKYAAMVITAGGDLSGSVVNTAARLQSRANKIARNKSNVLTTNQVVFSYGKALNKQAEPPFPDNIMAFLDLGPVQFKGLELRLAEVIIEEDQMYRASYQAQLDKLIDALGKNYWSEKIFVALSELITETAKAVPPFEVTLPEEREGLLSVANETVIIMMERINARFLDDRDYPMALGGLREIADILKEIENFDHGVLLYLDTVIRGYTSLSATYEKQIAIFSDKNKDFLFSKEEIKKFGNARISHRVYDRMTEDLIKRIDPKKRKDLWSRLAKEMGKSMKSLPYLAK